MLTQLALSVCGGRCAMGAQLDVFRLLVMSMEAERQTGKYTLNMSINMSCSLVWRHRTEPML